MFTTTRLRYVAGVCVLSTGLITAGAGVSIAVALADSDGTGSSNSSGQSTGGSTSGTGTGSESTGTGGTNAVNKPAPTADHDAESDSTPSKTKTAAKDDSDSPTSTAKTSTEGTTEASPAATESTPGSSAESATPSASESADPAVSEPSETVAASTPEPTATIEIPAESPAPVIGEQGGGSGGSAPAAVTSEGGGGNATPAGSATSSDQPTQTVAATVTDVVSAVTNVVTSVPDVINSAAVSATPITDVITAVQTALTTVVQAAAPLVPTTIDTLMLGDPAASNGLPGGGSGGRGGRMPAALAPVWLSALHSLHGRPDVGPLPEMTPTIQLMEGPAPEPSAMMGLIAQIQQTLPIPPAQSEPASTPAMLLHTAITKVLVPVSLWALFTAALPGIGGLIIVTAAGVRIGYRQAKAGFMVRSSGIARFAGPGPLGIVRSGTFVELHHRRGLAVAPTPHTETAPPVLTLVEQVA